MSSQSKSKTKTAPKTQKARRTQISNPNANNGNRSMSDPKPIRIQKPVNGRPRTDLGMVRRAAPSDLKAYYDQCVVPSSANASVVMPDRGSTQVTSRHFSRIVSVRADDYPNREVKIVMDPDLYSPAKIISGPVDIPSVGTAPITLGGSFKYTSSSTIGNQAYQANTQSEKILFPAWNDGFGNLGFGVTVADTRVTFAITNTPNNPSKFNIVGYDAVGAASDVFTFNLASGAFFYGEAFVNPLTVFFAVVPISGTTGTLISYQVNFFDAVIRTSLSNQYVGPAFAKQIIDDDISAGRVLSLSVLAHNTSNALSLGGNVTAARVPYDFNIFGDIQSDVARLPANRRYQDSASEGAHIFWVPRTAEEYQIAPIAEKAAQYDKSEFLLVDFTGLPAGATFLVQFDWIIEFYSPDQKWEKVMTPPITPKFEALWYCVLETQAATSNSSHLDLLRGLARNGKKAIGSIMDHYSDNKELYNGLASLLASIVL